MDKNSSFRTSELTQIRCAQYLCHQDPIENSKDYEKNNKINNGNDKEETVVQHLAWLFISCIIESKDWEALS